MISAAEIPYPDNYACDKTRRDSKRGIVNTMPRASAVIDTGFWGTCCRLGIHLYLTHVWLDPVLVPGAVMAEIFRQPAFMTNPTAVSWAAWGPWYRDQAEFLNAFLQRVLQPSNPNQSHLTLFHPGERAVLDMARERQADALIDEQKAHDYAITHGTDAVSIPEYLVILLKQGILTVTQTVAVFQQLVRLGRPPQPFIDWARSQLQAEGGQL